MAFPVSFFVLEVGVAFRGISLDHFLGSQADVVGADVSCAFRRILTR